MLTLDPARRILDADVRVADGRIAGVTPRGRGTRRRTAGADRHLDCTGLVIIPGLVQAHIHLCQTLFRGLAADLALEDWLSRRIWPLEAAHTRHSI